MPTYEEFKAYSTGKTYRRATEDQIELGEHALYIVDNKRDSKFFFCKLTGMKLPKKNSAVQKHIQGKNFLKKRTESPKPS